MLALYNENDPHAAEWLTNLERAGHIAPGRIDARDIRELVPEDVGGAVQFHAFAGIGAWSHALRLAGVPDSFPVWTGSCPCQPFSSAGRGRGFDDERHLWPEWYRLISECRPATIFGEQVASRAGRTWFDVVSHDLEALGYAVGAASLPACGVGAPHLRQRLFFVAHATDQRCEWRWASEACAGPAVQPERLGDAGGLADPAGQRAGLEGAPVQGRDRKDDGVLGADGEACGLAHSPGNGGQQGGEVGRGCRAGDAAPAERPGPGERGDSRRLAESAGERRDGLEVLDQPGRRDPEAAGCGRPSGVEHSESRRLGQGGAGAERPPGQGGARPAHAASVGDPGSTGGRRHPAGAAHNPWLDAVWIPCRDGKARPAQPGSFPLAVGSAGRVAVVRADGTPHWYNRASALRGIGNAIVPQVAAAFVRAAMAAMEENA